MDSLGFFAALGFPSESALAWIWGAKRVKERSPRLPGHPQWRRQGGGLTFRVSLGGLMSLIKCPSRASLWLLCPSRTPEAAPATCTHRSRTWYSRARTALGRHGGRGSSSSCSLPRVDASLAAVAAEGSGPGGGQVLALRPEQTSWDSGSSGCKALAEVAAVKGPLVITPVRWAMGGGMYRQPAPEDLHHQPVRPLQPRGGQILASLPHVQHLGEEAAEGSPKPHQARTATAEGRDHLLWGSGTSLQAPGPLLPPLTYAKMRAAKRSRASRWIEGSSSIRRGPSPNQL